MFKTMSTAGGRFHTSIEESAPMEEGFIQVWRRPHRVLNVLSKFECNSTNGGRFYTDLEASAPSAQGVLEKINAGFYN